MISTYVFIYLLLLFYNLRFLYRNLIRIDKLFHWNTLGYHSVLNGNKGFLYFERQLKYQRPFFLLSGVIYLDTILYVSTVTGFLLQNYKVQLPSRFYVTEMISLATNCSISSIHRLLLRCSFFYEGNLARILIQLKYISLLNYKKRTQFTIQRHYTFPMPVI